MEVLSSSYAEAGGSPGNHHFWCWQGPSMQWQCRMSTMCDFCHMTYTGAKAQVLFMNIYWLVSLCCWRTLLGQNQDEKMNTDLAPPPSWVWFCSTYLQGKKEKQIDQGCWKATWWKARCGEGQEDTPGCDQTFVKPKSTVKPRQRDASFQPCPGPHLPPAPMFSARQQHRSLYISAKFELMIGTVFVILHQAVLVSGIYLCYCFGSFFQGLFSSDMSGLQSKRNSEFTFTVRQAECYYPCICHQPADPSL